MTAIDSPERLVQENPPINSDRYAVEGLIGKGNWGHVYQVHDNITGETLAAKILAPNEVAQEQMRHRKLDPKKIMLNEGGFTASGHVVPRRLEVDSDGNYFIIMPKYKQSLDDYIRGDNFRTGFVDRRGEYVEIPFNQKGAFGLLLDIAKGLDDLHRRYRKVHGDLKLDNILIDESGNAHISDLGTATCASYGMSLSPRDKMGYPYTRAPENWKDGSHPTKQSDAWAFASIASRILTGKYLLQDEIDNTVDPSLLYEKLGRDGINKLIRNQLSNQNIPKRLQKFIRKCADFEPNRRPYDGRVLRERFEETIQNLSNWNVVRNSARKWGIPIAVASAAIAGIVYINNNPTQLDYPEAKVKGLLSREGAIFTPYIIQMDHEEISDLPEVGQLGLVGAGFNERAKASTNNLFTAYLLRCLGQANMTTLSFWNKREPVTEYQEALFKQAYTPEERDAESMKLNGVWPYWTCAVEDALAKSKTVNGKVDLEDVMAISRLGPDIILEAKRISGSNDWRDYRNAKRMNLEYVIPEPEQNLINTWLSYYYEDIDF